ncbi:hypothetical protein ZEAMMB73_Zm00001d008541 [Zea mays]|uniref:Uncharacterized protein n=1 Tax=Zea mays TaxID=4577 RepID=A0A1D6FDU9_MAIZE|nr:hypothetical protein ZEAMMB73_Zm00001d008541 [Zea mays]
MEPDVVDFFGECMNSPRNGRTPLANEIYVRANGCREGKRARRRRSTKVTLQAQQATLEENQSLLCQTQEEVKGMHTKFEETNALLRAVLKLQKD